MKNPQTCKNTETKTSGHNIPDMKTTAIIGLSLLALIWLWLAWMLLTAGGVNLRNIMVMAMSAIIIFVPLYKKFTKKN